MLPGSVWQKLASSSLIDVPRLLAGEAPPAEPLRVPTGGVVLQHSANHLAVEDPILRRVMSYLYERIQDPITIDLLCGELNIARRGLERKFREFYQCTPWEMLCQLRVARAKQLLLQTNHPISLVSELCGFNDPERMAVVLSEWRVWRPQHFGKVFVVN